MKMKRLTALILMFCMLVCMIPPVHTNAAVLAAGTCGDNLSVTLDDTYTLTISGTGNMYNGILNPSPVSNQDVKKVVIQPGVQGIGIGAFGFYTSMEELHIPDTVTSIGASALVFCGALKDVYYNNTYAHWKTKAEFAETFDRGYTLHCTDGTYQMCGFTAQWQLDEQGKLTVFGEGKMMDSDSWSLLYSPWEDIEGIREVVISDGITNLGTGMFFVCKELETVWLADSVTSIGTEAFSFCENLPKIRIPDAVTAIGYHAFFGCDKLADVEYTGTFESWKNQDIHYDAFESAYNLHCSDGTYQMCGSEATWTLDADGNLQITGEGVIKGKGWLGNAELVKNVTIADSVTGIGSWAFNGCTAMTSVNMHENITLLDYGAFASCSGLTSVQIPGSITAIPEEAFSCCTSLTSIQIPDSVTEIGDYAFSSCHSLVSIDLPDGITTLNDGVFGYCSSLKNVKLPANLETVCIRAFEYCSSLEEIAFPSGTCTIGDIVFYECRNLRKVTIPRSVTAIGDGVFSFCEKLEGIQYEGTLADWMTVDLDAVMLVEPCELYCTDGTYWLCGSTAVWTLDDKGHLEITGSGILNGKYWMGHNSDIRMVTIQEGITKISADCFSDCHNLQSVHISESVTEIGSYAFAWCNSLTEIALPDNLEKIPNGMLLQCINLKTVSIPDSVTEISQSAFYLCDQLTDVYYGGTQAQWEAIDIDTYNTQLTSATIHYNHVHTWQTATCTNAKTCSVCGATNGTALGHNWQLIACDKPMTCTRCHASSGRPAGHIYDNNVDGTCNVCNVNRENVEERVVVHMFRMYNPNTGEHFYTGSTEERDNLIGHGWQYEGVGFTFPANTGDPVHRLFQPSTGEHLYTMDVAEKDKLMAEGWNYEGIAFNSAYNTEAVQHRLHNPNATVGAYHFTFSEEEMNNLIAAGWEYQGIGWYSCWK